MPGQNIESGLRNQRVEFIREADFTEVPADPDYLKYSGVISDYTWTPSGSVVERRTLGSADPFEFQKGAEEHEFEISYDLIKWFTSGGEANDAAYDGIQRDADNLLSNSHTIVTREDKGAISEAATVDAAQGGTDNGPKSTRIYTVGHGGLIDECTVNGEASEAAILGVELSYVLHKARSYQIDQPDDATLLTVSSTSSNDTTQTVTIEDEGANTTADVSLDGTTEVSTASGTEFEDIDAIWLDAETEGDVVVSVNSGDDTTPSAEEALAVINGKDSYDGTEGDRGVPALGGGSREATPTGDYEAFIGGQVLRDANAYHHEISSFSVTASNDIESVEVTDSLGMSLYPGSRELTAEATMFGENASHDLVVEHLTKEENDLTWELSSGNLVLNGAALSEPGDRAVEEGAAIMTTDNVFMGKDLTITEV